MFVWAKEMDTLTLRCGRGDRSSFFSINITKTSVLVWLYNKKVFYQVFKNRHCVEANFCNGLSNKVWQNLCQLTTHKKKSKKEIWCSLFNKQMTKCNPAIGEKMISHSKNLQERFCWAQHWYLPIITDFPSKTSDIHSCSSLPHPVTVVCCLCLLIKHVEICRGVGNIKNAKAGIHDSQHFLYRVRTPKIEKIWLLLLGWEWFPECR